MTPSLMQASRPIHPHGIDRNGSPLAHLGLLLIFALLNLPGLAQATSPCLPSGDETTLQAAINQAPLSKGYYRVSLCQGAVFQLNDVVVLRDRLDISTEGLPTDPTRLAKLVLSPTIPNITILNGYRKNDVRIRYLEIDGQRRVLKKTRLLSDLRRVELLGLGQGELYLVENVVLRDSPGWTHLHLLEDCKFATVRQSRVFASPDAHDSRATWSDGLSVACGHSVIEDNLIEDASDAAIVYFGGPGTIIRRNTILQKRGSSFAGINVGDAVRLDHTGVEIHSNQILTQGIHFLHSGITIGLHLWGLKFPIIEGVRVYNNLVGGIVRYGYTVDGCVDCEVTGNRVSHWRPLVPHGACPSSAPYVADVSSSEASGALDPLTDEQGKPIAYVDANVNGCLGPPSPLQHIYRLYAGSSAHYPNYLNFEVAIFTERMEQGLTKEQAFQIIQGHWLRQYNNVQAMLENQCGSPSMTPDRVQRYFRIFQQILYTAQPPIDEAEALRQLEQRFVTDPSLCSVVDS